MIEKEIKILNHTLSIRKGDMERKEGQRDINLEDLRVLALQVIREERKMEDIIGSSVRQQEANKVLAITLSKLQDESDTYQ